MSSQSCGHPKQRNWESTLFDSHLYSSNCLPNVHNILEYARDWCRRIRHASLDIMAAGKLCQLHVHFRIRKRHVGMVYHAQPILALKLLLTVNEAACKISAIWATAAKTGKPACFAPSLWMGTLMHQECPPRSVTIYRFLYSWDPEYFCNLLQQFTQLRLCLFLSTIASHFYRGWYSNAHVHFPDKTPLLHSLT